MHIRELSQLTGASLRSLRYYEQKHLLTPSRSENGYRMYDELDVERVRKIQLYLKLGVSTEELARLFRNCEGFSDHSSDHQAECTTSFYEERLEEVRQQIQLLQEAEAHLERLVLHWKHRIKPK
ncbi:MerR family transcriptional regulator [Paenibacillus sp.]|jgi:DNA-binding transcriptional MerR regulator|uniref:MerR family transcriptional regulator n=1 Tax=Paenibacillus sp. TaxID=58172 RepID=UPI00281F8E93|nr:MerR family transcriptional regulator [Paenibacillus sp.]MDR0269569.1 MerR family transcriptional regulator [Paenibacillus sp.]